MWNAGRRVVRFGRSARGAVTVDFVALTALVIVIMIGFGEPIILTLLDLAEATAELLTWETVTARPEE